MEMGITATTIAVFAEGSRLPGYTFYRCASPLSNLYRLFLRRPGSPGGEHAPGSRKVWLLYIAQHLLVERLVVVRHAAPLMQERYYRPEHQPQVLNKALAGSSAGAEFQQRGVRLNVLKS